MPKQMTEVEALRAQRRSLRRLKEQRGDLDYQIAVLENNLEIARRLIEEKLARDDITSTRENSK